MAMPSNGREQCGRRSVGSARDEPATPPPRGRRADSRPSGRMSRSDSGRAHRREHRKPDRAGQRGRAPCSPRRRPDRATVPARITASGCSVIGTGVPGNRNRDLRRPRPPPPRSRRRRRAVSRTIATTAGASVVIVMTFSATLSATASPPPRQSVASPRCGIAIPHRVQQGREHARAARADRMAERDRAAVHVHAIPVPVERLRRRRAPATRTPRSPR